MFAQALKVAERFEGSAEDRSGWGSRIARDPGQGGLFHEHGWRRGEAFARSGAEILASRWTDARASRRVEEAQTPDDRYVVALCLQAVRLRLVSDGRTLFDGVMPSGAAHLAAPGQRLWAEFQGPCDFIHLSVAAACLRSRLRAAGGEEQASPSDRPVRDPLVEQLGRTLTEGAAGDGVYAQAVSLTIITRLLGLLRARPGVSALPKWRLKRVQALVDEHLAEPISLPQLAAAAGLSRMHFAAQFRAATGYRPHEYLTCRRIELAKSMLSSTQAPLAEVAFSVGFQAQAHFSTVFKRLTGQTPARWRRAWRDQAEAGADLITFQGSQS
jgi:AraC family transcriptional regulator